MSKKKSIKKVAHQTTSSKTTQSIKKEINQSSFNISNKVLIPAILLLFLILTLMYCKPILDGQRLTSHDGSQYNAMTKQIADYKAETGKTLLWNDRLFGGMPAFLIGGIDFGKLTKYFPLSWIHKIFRLLPDPAMEIIFLLICSFIGFYVLLKRPLLAMLGALAVGFAGINITNLDAGHVTKVITTAMFIPLLAGVYLLYNKKYFLGTILTMFFSYEIISGAHVQIAYYSLIIIGTYILFSIVNLIKEKDFKTIGIASVLFGICLSVSVFMNFSNYFVNDFSKQTTRGGDILHKAIMDPEAAKANPSETKKEAGVGFDYATQWSYGFEELGAIIIPNFTGGSSGGALSESSKTYQALVNKGVQPMQAAQFIRGIPLYWGTEPFVQGPMYFGIICVLLFVFGCFVYKGKLKYWIIAAIVLCFLIAFGKNLAFFYKLLYNIIPGFNKFRAPTMILVLAQALMALMGLLGLNAFFSKDFSVADRLAVIKKTAISVLSVLVLLLVIGTSIFSFKSGGDNNSDEQFKTSLKQSVGDEAFANEIYSAVIKDRKAIMQKDTIRSIIYVLLVLALLFVYTKGYLKQRNIIIASIALLLLIDNWSFGKRYLNDDDFSDPILEAQNNFPLTDADKFILDNNKDGARMIDLTGNVFNSASPAYYHRTIGGYNPAKLRRYQDIIEYGISYDLGENAKAGLAKANYINILNNKYLKQGVDANSVIVNNSALGNAWMVNHIDWVKTPEEEILGVRDINPATTAVIMDEFKNDLNNFTPNTDSVYNENRYVKLVDSKNTMNIKYQFKSDKPELVVFSEIIYNPNRDWISYIDGKQVDHIRADYILRAMPIPAGSHEITFEFKPKLYATTNTIINIGHILFYIVIGIALFLFFRKKKQKEVINE